MDRERIEEVKEWVQDLFSCGMQALAFFEAREHWPKLTADEWKAATEDYFVSETGLTVFNAKRIGRDRKADI